MAWLIEDAAHVEFDIQACKGSNEAPRVKTPEQFGCVLECGYQSAVAS
jgi:hypothetical protein